MADRHISVENAKRVKAAKRPSRPQKRAAEQDGGRKAQDEAMPQATVAAIITTTDRSGTKILLTRRNIEPFKEQWCLPGGHIDQYESAKDAIIREVKEETGLDFDASFLNYFDERIPEHNIHAVVMVFTGRGTGLLRAQEDEVSNIDWFPIDEARSLQLAFTHNKILDAYAAQMKNGDTHAELLAEYSALRSEILQRIDMRQQILTFTLVIAGTVLSLGVQTNISPLVLLIYPVLALFLATAWMHSDVRIWEVAEYIEKQLEPRLGGIGWETYIHNKHQGQSFRPMEVTAAGVFLTTEVLAVILAIPRLSYSLEEVILLIIAAIAFVLTLIPLRRRTAAIRKSEVVKQG